MIHYSLIFSEGRSQTGKGLNGVMIFDHSIELLMEIIFRIQKLHYYKKRNDSFYYTKIRTLW